MCLPAELSRSRFHRLAGAGAIAGIAGPAAFTAAWATASLLQTGHSATEVQISGLAAPDARDPWIMITGFTVLGCCSVAFGSALRAELGRSGRPGLGPRLIQAAGVLTVAAGLLRRDRILLTGPPGQSWHNHAHDLVAVPIYIALVAAPLVLARRFRGDRRWAVLRLPLAAGSVATAAVLAVFAVQAAGPWAGVLQRVAVTLPLAAMSAVAVRLLATRPGADVPLSWRHGRSQGDPAGRRPGGGGQQPGQGLLPAERAYQAGPGPLLPERERRRAARRDRAAHGPQALRQRRRR